MTPPERILDILNRQPVDRSPIDLWYTPEIRDAAQKFLSSTGIMDGRTVSPTVNVRPLYGDTVGQREIGGFRSNKTEFIQWLHHEKRPWEIP